MHDAITYDIFRNDSAGNPVWVEAVDGLEQAMNRMENLAAGDASSDYFLYCTRAEKVVRRLQRKLPRPDDLSGTPRRKIG
ncbi:MAG: hypothetical protein WB987_08105 [Candidatus Acidiferrales bacterium]